MTPEEREMLEESLELSRENNKMLKRMKRAAMYGRIIKIVYLIVILVLTFGVYYFIQPYLDVLTKGYSDVMSGVKSIKGIGDTINNSVPKDIQSIIETIGI